MAIIDLTEFLRLLFLRLKQRPTKFGFGDYFFVQPRFSEVSKSDFVAGFFCQSDEFCAGTLGIFDDGAKINPGIGIPLFGSEAVTTHSGS